MKATEITKGNVLRNKAGLLVYEVLWVEEPDEDNEIQVGVKFFDGGGGVRVFDADEDVPLTTD